MVLYGSPHIEVVKTESQVRLKMSPLRLDYSEDCVCKKQKVKNKKQKVREQIKDHRRF